MNTATLLAAGLLLAVTLPAQQFSPAAMLPGDDTVAPSAGNQSRPAIAAGGGGLTLAVWQDDRSSLVDSVFGEQLAGSSVPGNVDIFGVLLDAQGQPLTFPIVINRDAYDQLDPKVAWNGTEYLVVFSSKRPTGVWHSRGIWATRVTAAGVVRDLSPIQIADDPGFDEHSPAITSLGGNWLVTWTDLGSSGYEVIRGALVQSNGAVGASRVLITTPAGLPPSDVQLAAAGGRYAAIWGLAWTAGAQVALFDAALQPVGAPLTLTSASASQPAIGSDGSGFFVSWFSATAFALVGSPLSATGVLANPGGRLLVPGPMLNPKFGIAHDGSEWLVAFNDDPSVRAQRVSANGTPIGGAFVVSTSSRQSADCVAGNGNGRVLLAWSDSRTTPPPYGLDIADVFACTIATGGVVAPAVPITVSAPAQIDARLAGSPAQGFLLVWQSLIAGVTTFLGRALDATGNTIGAPFVLHSGNRALGFLDVAANGQEFAVAWSELQGTDISSPPPNVYCRRCRLDGTLLEPAPVLVMEGYRARLDAVGSEFLITSIYHHVQRQSTPLLRYRRLDGATGAFVDATPRVLQTGANAPFDVVGMRDRWLIVWGAMTGAFVLADGTPMTPFYAADCASSTTRMQLAVDESGDEAVVAYQYRSSSPFRTDISLRRFRSDGTSPDPVTGPTVSTANQAQLRPTIASLDGEYLVAWADHRAQLDIEPGIGDVFAARLSPAGALLDPNGIAVHARPGAEGAPTLIRSGLGRALLVASVLDEVAFGTHRLMLQSYANGSAAPWSTVGTGIAGIRGIPSLTGYGVLQPQTSFALTLADARPGALALLVLGLTPQNTPLLGGTLIPAPGATVLGSVGNDGRSVFSTLWPQGFAGVSLWAQQWVLDPAAVQGAAATAGALGVGQ
ncbi:MAG: hypothetical protein IPK26_03315 [Planctomycetes bacterium]|nr:hypothetical protein [Planctomycetota bacterium]